MYKKQRGNKVYYIFRNLSVLPDVCQKPPTGFLIKQKTPVSQLFTGVFITGPAGFEPTDAGVKVLCLTAWRWPNIVEKNPCYLNKDYKGG